MIQYVIRLGAGQFLPTISTKAQTYLWRRCCLRSYLRWLYDDQVPRSDQGFYHNVIPRDTCDLTPKQDKSTKSRSMLVIGYSPRQGLLVQDKAACQWQVVQGMATCQWQVVKGKWSKSRMLVQLVQLAEGRGIATKKAGRTREIIR